MSLRLHLSIHFFFSLLAGLVSWVVFGNPIACLVGGILGGFFVDVDHFVDYFMAFGPRFNFEYFCKGYQFVRSGKLYILFHGWEIVALLFLASFFVSGIFAKPAFVALVLGMFLHILSDVFINEGMSIKAYSLLYRMKKGFVAQKIVTPEQYQKDLLAKQTIHFE